MDSVELWVHPLLQLTFSAHHGIHAHQRQVLIRHLEQ